MNITLIGMPGAGKSYIGAELARLLGLSLVDPDKLIEAEHGAPLQDVLDTLGDEAFLRKEALMSVDIIRNADGIVLSTGGSIVYSEEAMRALSDHSRIVYLRSDYDTVAVRVGDKPRGIVGLGNRTLRELYDERCALYEKWAHATVDASKDAQDVVADIRVALLV